MDFAKRLARDKQYDPYFWTRVGAESKLLAQTFCSTPRTPFWKKTAIWQLLRQVKRRIFSRIRQRVSGEQYISWRRHRQNAVEVRDMLPDLSSALEEYSRNINAIIDLAEEKSMRLVFLTQATMWRSNLPRQLDELLWVGGIGNYQEEIGKPYYSVEALAEGMKAYNETLLRICRDRRIECVDLAFILPKNTTVFYDDVHFNENGAAMVAEALSECMLRSPPPLVAQDFR